MAKSGGNIYIYIYIMNTWIFNYEIIVENYWILVAISLLVGYSYKVYLKILDY